MGIEELQKKNTRFADNVKEYLKSVFNEGEKNGCKSNPNIARNLRICTDETGQKRFRTKDYLNSCQIVSYFFRLAAQSRQPDVVDEDLETTIALINKAEAIEDIDLSFT